LRRFVLNGLSNANEILGEQVFDVENWKVVGQYVYDEEGGRHEAFVAPLRTTNILGSTVLPHERIQIEQSLKYSTKELEHLLESAGLTELERWTQGDEYGKSDNTSVTSSRTRLQNMVIFFMMGLGLVRITPRFSMSCACRWNGVCILLLPNPARCVSSVSRDSVDDVGVFIKEGGKPRPE
jgi:hypothetical protein